MQENTSYPFTPVSTSNFLSPEATVLTNSYVFFMRYCMHIQSCTDVYIIYRPHIKQMIFFLILHTLFCTFTKIYHILKTNPFPISVYKATSLFLMAACFYPLDACIKIYLTVIEAISNLLLLTRRSPVVKSFSTNACKL